MCYILLNIKILFLKFKNIDLSSVPACDELDHPTILTNSFIR